MCLELMLSAANLTLIAFSRFRLVDGLPDYNAQALVFFTITVAAAEVAVGLAIIVALFRAKQRVDVGAVDNLKG
jgi:NADH-quinone oxidoreductase subunit K